MTLVPKGVLIATGVIATAVGMLYIVQIIATQCNLRPNDVVKKRAASAIYFLINVWSPIILFLLASSFFAAAIQSTGFGGVAWAMALDLAYFFDSVFLAQLAHDIFIVLYLALGLPMPRWIGRALVAGLAPFPFILIAYYTAGISTNVASLRRDTFLLAWGSAQSAFLGVTVVLCTRRLGHAVMNHAGNVNQSGVVQHSAFSRLQSNMRMIYVLCVVPFFVFLAYFSALIRVHVQPGASEAPFLPTEPFVEYNRVIFEMFTICFLTVAVFVTWIPIGRYVPTAHAQDSRGQRLRPPVSEFRSKERAKGRTPASSVAEATPGSTAPEETMMQRPSLELVRVIAEPAAAESPVARVASAARIEALPARPPDELAPPTGTYSFD